MKIQRKDIGKLKKVIQNIMDKKLMGKKSRASGMRFEAKVRADLEKNWIVSKWQNNVEFPERKLDSKLKTKEDVEERANIELSEVDGRRYGRLIKAKPKFVYSPGLKRRIPMGLSSGFPDYLAMRRLTGKEILEILKNEI